MARITLVNERGIYRAECRGGAVAFTNELSRLEMLASEPSLICIGDDAGTLLTSDVLAFINQKKVLTVNTCGDYDHV